MEDTTELVEKFEAHIAELRLKHHAAQSDPSNTVDAQTKRTDEITGKLADLSNVIAQGANPCPHCGVVPHGMRATPKSPDYFFFQVGCLNCRDCRAEGRTPAKAVEKWNAGVWCSPKDPARGPDITPAK